MRKCPACNGDISLATEALEDGKLKDFGTAEPKPGDYSVCAHCGKFLMFTEDSVRLMTTEEFEKTLTPKSRCILENIRDRIAVTKMMREMRDTRCT